MKSTVITDASYLQGGHAGWAGWIRVDGIPTPIKEAGILRRHPYLTDSNMAEVFAALNGIWHARRNGGQDILVRSDNMMVGSLIEGQAKSERFLEIWREAFARPDMQIVRLTFKHVKGHTNDPAAASWVNRWCDEQAGFYSRKAREQNSRKHRPRSKTSAPACPQAEGIPRGI